MAHAACAAVLAGLLVACPLPGTAAAQEQAQADLTSTASIDGKTQTLYTSQNGLPSTVSTAIAQTPDGFVWIGGYEGLTCFDGQIFEPQNDAPKFSVSSLLATKDGSLWIGTSNHGLYRYANEAYEQLECLDCDKGVNEVSCMTEGPDGTILVGSEHGLAKVDANGYLVEMPVEGLPEVLIRSIATSGEATMAVTPDGHLFHLADGKASEITLQGATGTPRCVSFDSTTQSFYVGTNRNTVCILSSAGAQQAQFDIEGATCINSVHLSEEGVTWICADNGVFSYQNDTTTKQNLQIDNSVDSMLVDIEGNYWFASSRQGTLLVANTPFKDISSCANIPSAVVNAVVKYDGKLIIGTDSGAVAIDPITDSIADDPRFDVLDSLRIRTFKVDSANNLWVATANGGVLRMNEAGEWTSFTKETADAITTNNFRCLYETEEGMIAGGEEGAIIIDDAGVRNVVSDASTLNARVLSISQMGSVLLLGTESYGLQLVEDGTVVGSLTTKDGLDSNSIMKIYPCSNGKDVLLATSSGLAKATSNAEQAPKHYSEGCLSVDMINNFPVSNTLDLVWQGSDIVWVAAGNGIYKTTEESLLSNETIACKLYTRQDGLPYDVTANSTQLVDGNMMYLCGTGGLSALDTKEAAAATDSCIPSVTGAYADGQLIPLGADNTITIPANAQRVKIMAHATTFNKTNITLFYKLDGCDPCETITPLSNFDGLEYTNLGGGTYQLQFGAWDEATQAPINSVAVTIKKEYSLLDHPATRVLGIAVVLALIALAFAWRRRHMREQLKKEYEEKERHALEKMAYSDFLTEAYNRNYLNKWVQKACAKAYRFPISLITIDLNNLKLINDTMGHLAGDEYLRCTTKTIFEAFGQEGTWVVRLGGDEFLVIAEGMQRDEAAQRVERMRQDFQQHSAGQIGYGFCYGVATIDSPEFSLDEKLRCADEQMVEEKRRYHKTYDRRRS